MCCMVSLSSQTVVLGAAMAVSTTLLFLAFSKHKSFPPSPILRSCLSSSDEKRKEKKKRKKRVKFAENVKDTKGNGEEYRRRRREKEKYSMDSMHNNDIDNRMPANRVALYNGILRDRVHRLQCSY